MPKIPSKAGHAARVVFLLTVLGNAGSLVLAIWPGMLEGTLYEFPCCFLSLPLLGCWFVTLTTFAIYDLVRDVNRFSPQKRWSARALGLTIATFAQLWLHAPQRVAIAVWRSQLEELVAAANAAPLAVGDGIALNRQVGPYHIDRCGRGRSGGIFFRTHVGPDGIGPDQMSYGFAFEPNIPEIPEARVAETPFGGAGYRQRRLLGNWYVFSVSDDW